MTRTERVAAGLRHGADGVVRCAWCGTSDDYVAYHDIEWGTPVHDDVRLFEKISLEGFQAGLSWLTILRKRENFRRAFQEFDPERVAAFGPRDVKRLLANAGIVRHRGKIEAVINNAKRFLELQKEQGAYSTFVWNFAPPDSTRPKRITPRVIPPQTAESRALSAALKKRGWRFVGPTTCYAFFQAMGLVNDHIEGCERRGEVEALRLRSSNESRTGSLG